MKRVRLIISTMLICITLTYFCSDYIPKALFVQIVVFSVTGLFASLMSLAGKGSRSRSVVFLCLWMLAKQIQNNIAFTNILSLGYRTLSAVAGFFFAYCLAVDEEKVNRKRFSKICLGHIRFKYMHFPDFLLCVMIIWGILFLREIEYERGRLNWGFANYSYFLLMLFPILPLSKNQWLKRGSVLLLIIAILVSRKRTGIILLLLCAMIAALLAIKDKQITRRKGIAVVSCSAFLLCAFLFTDIADRMFGSFFYRFRANDAESLNGRTDIWIYGINKWMSGGPMVWMFGGDIQYKTNTGEFLTMHNDFIEILVNYGLVGVALLGSVFFDIVRNIMSSQKLIENRVIHSLIYTLVVMFVLMSASHIIIYPYMLFLLLLTVGYCYGVIDVKKENEIDAI